MTTGIKLRWLSAGVLCSVVTSACDERKPPRQTTSPEASVVAPAASSAIAVAEPTEVAPSSESEEPERELDGSMPSSFVVDELVDVAPAGPASASTAGVVLITRSDEVKLAKLGRLIPSSAPGRSPVSELDVADEQFAPLARGPAIVGSRAYWISKNRLVRAPLVGGPVEVLASDARRYTRVVAAAPAKSTPAAVAYLASKPNDLSEIHARLWVEGHGSLTLSPEGSGASSVALAEAESGWLALVLEGRTGMTPLHARAIQFVQGSPRLASDVVVWVGGSAQALSEVHAIGEGDHAWAFLAMERDVTHFGLAKLRIESEPKAGSDIAWRNYPNGLDPAPAAPERVCGKSWLLYARPSSERPHAPQELCAAAIEGDRLGAAAILARARAFSDVSMVALAGGALVSYVADHRTWAMTLRCRSD